MRAIQQCVKENYDRFKRTESRWGWESGGGGGRSTFRASGDEPEGPRPLQRIERPEFSGNLGGNAEALRPMRDEGLLFVFARAVKTKLEEPKP